MDTEFSRTGLKFARAEAKMRGVTIPKGMTAVSCGTHLPQYLVEWRNADGTVAGVEVQACDAFEARAEVIDRMIEGKIKL